jgi:hypothetical protein
LFTSIGSAVCFVLARFLIFRNNWRMSYYAHNHLHDDWASHATDDMTRRQREAERTAGWYFDRATRRQKAEHEAGRRGLLGMTGPKWDRARDALQRRWQETTADARALFEATVQCLLDSGEVSSELDDAWTTLCEREDATAQIAAE